jgi:glucokinase
MLKNIEENMSVIGMDLGGTKLASAIFNNDEIILQKNLAINKRKGFEVSEIIIKQIKEFLEYSKQNDIQISAIGISVPGIAYSKTGNVWAPNIKGWEDFPLLEEIRKNIGKNIQIKIDSDRACYILGEVWKGAAKDCKDAIYLAVGTGIGAGILANGEIIRGANDIAGAIGWLALDRPFQNKYISCGCFEHHASGEGIAKIAKELLQENPEFKSRLREKNISEITSHDVFAASDDGDELAEKVLNIAIEFWGMTIANLVSLFNPEKIILGGGVFGPAIKFIDRINDEAKKWAQPISITQVEITSSSLGSDAGLYGAGYLALKISK